MWAGYPDNGFDEVVEKAGDRIRTGDVQLGKLATHSVTSDGAHACESEAATTSSTASKTDESPPSDADLRRIVEAWPMLSDALRAGIVAIVRSAGEGEE